MNTAKNLLIRRGLASKNDIYRVEQITGGLIGLQSLSKNARSWVLFFTELICLGYDGIRAPMGAISDAHYRATGGNKSLSSAFRALRELKKHGYHETAGFRVGKDSKTSIIRFNIDRFEFFLRGRDTLTDIGNCAGTYYIDTPMSICQADDLTVVTSPKVRDVSTCNKKASCMPKKESLEEPKTGSGSLHGVYYSLKCVLYRQKHPALKKILKLASSEITGRAKSSLTDWEYWLSKWGDLSVEARENLIIHNVLPAYDQRFKMDGPDLAAQTSSPLEEKRTRSGNDQGEKLNQIIFALAGREPFGELEQKEEPREAQQTKPQANLLSPEDYAVLRAARDRAKERKS
jgi:hypothetical protein